MSAVEDLLTDDENEVLEEDSQSNFPNKIERKLENESISPQNLAQTSSESIDAKGDGRKEVESTDTIAHHGQGDSSIVADENLLKVVTNEDLSPDIIDKEKEVKELGGKATTIDDFDDEDMELKWDDDDNSDPDIKNDSKTDTQTEDLESSKNDGLKSDKDTLSSTNLSKTIEENATTPNVVDVNKGQEIINTQSDSIPADVINIDNTSSVSKLPKTEEINQGVDKIHNIDNPETPMDTDHTDEIVKDSETITEGTNQIQEENCNTTDQNLENLQKDTLDTSKQEFDIEPPADEIKHDSDLIKNETSENDISFDVSLEFYNKGHDLNRPDAMLEIPTQELIDIDDLDLTIDKSVANLTIDKDNSMVEEKEVETYKNDEEIQSVANLDENLSGNDVIDPEELKIKSKDKGDNVSETQQNVNEQEGEKIGPNVGENKDQIESSENLDISSKKVTEVSKDITDKASESIDVPKKDNLLETDSNLKENLQKDTLETTFKLETDTEQPADEIEPNRDLIKDEISEKTNGEFYNKGHDLNRPDAMLEIPTQDIDIDDLDLTTDNTIDKSVANLTIEKDNSMIEEEAETAKTVETPSMENLDTNLTGNDVNKDENAIGQLLTAALYDVQPSTSKAAPTSFMTPDTSDEMPEVSDSLGLLAESSGRMMDDDDDDGDGDDDDGDGDDYDQDMDESSNQVSPEALEDSNAASEIALEQKEIEEQELDTEESNDFVGEIQISVGEVDFDVDKDRCSEANLDNAGVNENVDKEKEKEADIPTDTNNVITSAENDEKDKTPVKSDSPKHSPSKVKKLEITQIKSSNVLNIVDLGESSSEDDAQVVTKKTTPPPDMTSQDEDVLTVNIPTGIDIMCSGANTSDIVTKDSEVVINVPKPPPPKPARLNTSEVTIKTTTTTESTLVIPETKNKDTLESPKPKMGLEIFSLDSDEEETTEKQAPPEKQEETSKPQKSKKCINLSCTSGSKGLFKMADAADILYYDSSRRRRTMICEVCADIVDKRTLSLVAGIKNMTPLFELDMDKGERTQDLVEISDSESEEEDVPVDTKEGIGIKGAKLLEENLVDMLNEAWLKYNLDARLNDTKDALNGEIEKLDQANKEINKMLDDCQKATDILRNDFYSTFEPRKSQLPAWSILDTSALYYIGPEEKDSTLPPTVSDEIVAARASKRRSTSSVERIAKRPAIPMGYTPLDESTSQSTKPDPVVDSRLDDDKDVSVVQLSVESAPTDLPPPGPLVRPPLRVNQQVYAMKNAFGPWLKGRVVEVYSKENNPSQQFTSCRVKFDHKTKVNGKVLSARCIAYSDPAEARMSIGTRLIGLFKDSNQKVFYSGVVAEVPNPVNNYRYLVFFDDGYAQYVQHSDTRLVCECSNLVWEEVHPFSREFVREYLLAYPERPMVRLHEGQHLKTEWNGKWWSSKVVKVDASLAQVLFLGDGRQEWIYRGSTRLAPLYLELQAAERHRPRPLPRSKGQNRTNMPYVEYTRSDDQEAKKQDVQQQQQQQSEEIRRQRAVAKKSTSMAAPPQHQTLQGAQDTISSRVVYYTPKNAVKPNKMAPHVCSNKCKRTDVLSLQELRTYNPLAKPLLSGWERQIVRFKGHREVLYRAPCGRRIRCMKELHMYLRRTQSELPVDLFDFQPATHCLAEFVLNKCIVGKKDLSHGKENVPVPCVNYYDDTLPEFCSYNTERTPTAGVPLNLDPEFLCGCDCTDDCEDKTKCACWKMTLEGARTIGLDFDVGYVYKRLPDPLPSGIYECNSRCKCKHTCLNRVAQHPLQLKLQVFKTLNRGWGIRALNDVPKGSFLCVYAGNLLTDATANLDGLNEGDEYLAELDYIEVVEQMKEGYEEDIPEADKKLDKKETEASDEEEDPTSSEEEENTTKSDKEDGDFSPGFIAGGVTEFSKRLRKRDRNKKEKKENQDNKETKEKTDDDCITISDDEERREPSRFAAQPGMGANDFVSKYRSVRTLFGKDEACYIMDAKVQGNIGRYLNHSCTPNVFVQNVFVDTHDPRFPWVAFFALSHIKAGSELTWNYNYDIGSVPSKVLYCYCGAPNCRGRLL